MKYFLAFLLIFTSSAVVASVIHCQKFSQQHNDVTYEFFWKKGRGQYFVLRSYGLDSDQLGQKIKLNGAHNLVKPVVQHLEYRAEKNSHWKRNIFKSETRLVHDFFGDQLIVWEERGQYKIYAHGFSQATLSTTLRFDKANCQREKIEEGYYNETKNLPSITVTSAAQIRGSAFVMQIGSDFYLISASHIFRGTKLQSVYGLSPGWILTDNVYDNPDIDVIAFELRQKDKNANSELAIKWANTDIIDPSLKIIAAHGIINSTRLITLDLEQTFDRLQLVGLPPVGTSGAPILDGQGRFIGLFQQIQVGGVYSYALPANRLVESVKNKTKAKSLWENGMRVAFHKGKKIRFLEDLFSAQSSEKQSGDGGLADGGDGGLADGGDGGLADGGGKIQISPTYFYNDRQYFLNPISSFPNMIEVDGIMIPKPGINSWDVSTMLDALDDIDEKVSWLSWVPDVSFEGKSVMITEIRNGKIEIGHSYLSGWKLVKNGKGIFFSFFTMLSVQEAYCNMAIEGFIFPDKVELSLIENQLGRNMSSINYNYIGTTGFSQVLFAPDGKKIIYRVNPYSGKFQIVKIINEEEGRLWIVEN